MTQIVVSLTLASCFVVGWTVRGHASSPTELRKAEALATEGKVYFRTRQFDKAADKFMQAFGVSKKPALLYNAARAYEEAHKLQEAIAMFRHYVSLPDATDSGKVAAQKKIISLTSRKAVQDRQKQAAKRAASGGTKSSGNTRKAAGKGSNAGAGNGKQRTVPTPKQRRGPRVFPLWRSIGSGTTLLFASAAYINAYRIATDMLPADVIDDSTKKQYQDNQTSARTWQIISVSAAVVGVGLGAWAGWDWWRSGKRTASIRLLPTLDGKMLTLQGSF